MAYQNGKPFFYQQIIVDLQKRKSMNFTNLQIAWDDLPQTKSADFQPVQAAYLKVLRITWSIVFALLLIALIALFIFTEELHNIKWMAIISIGYLLLLFATVLIGTGSFKRKSFAIREKDILYKTGWVFTDLNMVPFNRIQHCVVNSGPLERRFGLASLGIYTAAREVHDIVIKGLSMQQAEQLNSFILGQIEKEETND
jgi:membrane protein YdbS with pleckstrin-like domain